MVTVNLLKLMFYLANHYRARTRYSWCTQLQYSSVSRSALAHDIIKLISVLARTVMKN